MTAAYRNQRVVELKASAVMLHRYPSLAIHIQGLGDRRALEYCLAGKECSPCDDVPQFTRIAGPGVTLQDPCRCGRNSTTVGCGKMIGEGQQILRSGPKRR